MLFNLNSEIYNFRELYNELNITPKTNSDCEVIIHLYKQYGIEYTLSLLDGVFAFILYDRRHTNDVPVIHVARDPFGVRPFYILSSNNEYINLDEKDENNTIKVYDNIIAFSSELKVLQIFGKRQGNVLL